MPTGRAMCLLLPGVIAAALACGPWSAAAQPTTDVFVPPRSLGTTKETEPPRYVEPLAATGLPGTATIDWLHVGADYRIRVESRSNDLRRPTQVHDSPILLRTRAFVGVTRILDPLRFAVEVEDARRYGSQFARDPRDVNTAEPIQAYAELHLPDGLGRGRPLVARAGRFAFEALDRRLVSRNEWRNTTNTFQGLRVQLGTSHQAWSAEVIAAQPLARRLTALDTPAPGQWFTGVTADWRGWSRQVTFEPSYLRLTERLPRPTRRDIHAVGLRAYGPAGTTGVDYDASLHVQRGRDGAAAHRAWAAHGEVGHTFVHAWRPRLALFYGYASGDRQPADGRMERFERFFGFGRVWSANDYFVMENLATPRVSLELTPRRAVAVDTAYAAFWLASPTDRWAGGLLRDPSGGSGRFVGQEYSVRVRFPLVAHVDANVGHAVFVPGSYPRRLGKANVSQFSYVELTINPFR